MGALTQTKRVYPQLPPDTHPAIVQAFNQLHDNVYTLRDTIQKLSKTAATAPAPVKSPFTLDIAGIKVKAPTDSSSLQNGMIPAYNSTSGQFEFSTASGGVTELTGDVNAGPGSGSEAATVVGVNNAAVPASTAVLATNGSGQLVAAILQLTIGGTVLNPAGAINVIIWEAPFACTVTHVLGYVVGSTGSVINAQRNGSLTLLTSNLTVTSAATWMDGGTVQNTAVSAGDKFEIMIISVSGTPTQVAIEIQCTKP